MFEIQKNKSWKKWNLKEKWTELRGIDVIAISNEDSSRSTLNVS